MSRARAFLLPFFAVLVAGAVGAVITNPQWLFPDNSPYVPVTLGELDLRAHRRVVTEGLAHYDAVVRQNEPATLFTDARTIFLFGLFEQHDTAGRAIRVLVRTDRAPEDLVSFERMRVTGELRPVVPEEVPYDVEVMLGKNTEYFFSDDVMLLDAVSVETIGGED